MMKKAVYLVLAISLMFAVSTCKKDKSSNTAAATVKDIDGNIYNTVTIGTQVWMKENLNTTKFNDGIAIPNVTVDSNWAKLTTPGYCYLKNDSVINKNVYGALYNWYAVNADKLCPDGWHVPYDVEWTILINYLGGDTLAGGKMKEEGLIHWKSPNTGADNSSGFTALPGDEREEYDGYFPNQHGSALFWSTTEWNMSHGWSIMLFNYNINVSNYASNKAMGLSVRCVKD